MKRLLYFVLALTLITTPVWSQAKSDKDEAALRDRIDKVLAAWSAKDVKKASEFYAKDPDLAFYDVAPVKYNNWAEYEKGVVPLLEQHEYIKFKMGDDLAIHRNGKQAWVTATLPTDLKLKTGPPATVPIRWTSIWEKRGGTWVILHEHVSMAAPPPPQS
jgi:ketosteroid isomerase-like protein